MSATADLISVSQRVGVRIPHWIQGAGGNLSVKDGSHLYIKASGVRLDETRREADLVEVDVAPVSAAIAAIHTDDAAGELAYAGALRPNAGKGFSTGKPSMETGMHLFLPGKWVFHFHSLAALLMAHEHKVRPERFTSWVLAHAGGKIHMTPPVRPGLLLSTYVQKYAAATFFVLENHGVLIQGDRPTVLEEWDSFERKFCLEFGYDAVRGEAPAAPTPMRLYFPDSAVFLERLKAVLLPGAGEGEPRFVLAADARARDRDVVEIWNATQLLYNACPSLAELPASISQVVANLPTETYRQGRK